MSVPKAEEAVGLLADVVAIELMLAHDVLAVMPTRPTLGPGRAHAAVRARLADVARKGVA